MSFETIQIFRKIPIVNGFVRPHDALEKDRNAVDVDSVLNSVPDANLKKLEPRTGNGHRVAGLKFGAQEFIETPGVPIVDSNGNVNSGTISDTYSDVRNLF